MPRWNCECRSFSCEGCNLACKENPKGWECPNSSAEIYRSSLDRTEGDLTFSMSNRSDVRWLPHIRPALVRAQTKGGQLICGICSKAIPVDGNGKISYVSISGKTHVEYPPIDHHGPDWRVRKAKVENSAAFRNGDVMKQKQLLMAAFNAPPLRITCKSCNLTRPK